jgi:SAM-dependent methyltransferase
VPDFASFDQRGYRTVSAREGYDLWASSYEDTIKPEMDEWLLARITTIPWGQVRRAVDLGCGTGRTGQWLRGRGVACVDGVDGSPAMLDRARKRGVFDQLTLADVRSSTLHSGAYDLVTTCLVDEHLPELDPLYRESARLAVPGGRHLLVGFHPFFIMRSGMPTHFDAPGAGPIAIDTHVHLASDHVRAALAAGWTLDEMHEQVIDDRWIVRKRSWKAHRDVPVSFAFVWRRTV